MKKDMLIKSIALLAIIVITGMLTDQEGAALFVLTGLYAANKIFSKD